MAKKRQLQDGAKQKKKKSKVPDKSPSTAKDGREESSGKPGGAEKPIKCGMEMDFPDDVDQEKKETSERRKDSDDVTNMPESLEKVTIENSTRSAAQELGEKFVQFAENQLGMTVCKSMEMVLMFVGKAVVLSTNPVVLKYLTNRLSLLAVNLENLFLTKQSNAQGIWDDAGTECNMEALEEENARLRKLVDELQTKLAKQIRLNLTKSVSLKKQKRMKGETLGPCTERGTGSSVKTRNEPKCKSEDGDDDDVRSKSEDGDDDDVNSDGDQDSPSEPEIFPKKKLQPDSKVPIMGNTKQRSTNQAKTILKEKNEGKDCAKSNLKIQSSTTYVMYESDDYGEISYDEQSVLLDRVEVLVKNRNKSGILKFLDETVSHARQRKKVIPDLLRDNVNVKIMAAEMFTVGILEHSFFANLKNKKNKKREEETNKLVLDRLDPQQELQIIVSVTSKVVEKFHILMKCCDIAWKWWEMKKKEGKETSEVTKDQVVEMVEDVFQASNDNHQEYKNAVGHALCCIVLNDWGMISMTEFDSRFFYLVLQEVDYTNKIWAEIIEETTLKRDIALLHETILPVGQEGSLWILNRTREMDEEEFVKRREQDSRKSVYRGVVECCLVLAMGFLTEENCNDPHAAWIQGQETVIDALKGKVNEWLTSDRIKNRDKNMLKFENDRLKCELRFLGKTKYVWEKTNVVYKHKKDNPGLVIVIRNAGNALMGIKQYKIDTKSRLCKSLYIIAQVWQLGVVGLTSARVLNCHGGGMFSTRLAYAITGRQLARFTECQIPQVMENILPGLNNSGTEAKVGIHQLRFFDPIHYYGWGIPGWMEPIAMNVDLFVNTMKLAEENGVKEVGTYLTNLGKTFQGGVQKAALFLDLRELHSLRKQVAVQSLNVTYEQLVILLSQLRVGDGDTSKKVTHRSVNPQWSVNQEPTPGMNKYALSSQCQATRIGCWNLVTKKNAKAFAEKLTLVVKKEQKKKANLMMEVIENTKETVTEQFDVMQGTCKSLVKII